MTDFDEEYIHHLVDMPVTSAAAAYRDACRMPVALFTCRLSPYRRLLGDQRCWDVKRDARSYSGSEPVIAHPPCRGWGRFRQWSKHSQGEVDLAWFALELVRRNGGVLEHPVSSSFWRVAGIRPGDSADLWGGRLIVVNQCDFGHRAQKRTGLYMVRPECHLPLPRPVEPTNTVEKMGRQERERTPVAFAEWLIGHFVPGFHASS